MCCTWGWEIARLSVGVTQWTQLSVFAAHYFGTLGSDKKYPFSYKRIADKTTVSMHCRYTRNYNIWIAKKKLRDVQ